jgi:MinD-like ATPase involved in chromosome partitioning or flagellar assembly
MNKIMFYSIKGGTGRSTILANLAYQLYRIGYRVGLIDLDIYSSGLSLFFNIPQNAITIQDYLVDREIDLEELIRFFSDISNNFNIHGQHRGQLFILPSKNRIFESGLNINLNKLMDLINFINENYNNRLDFVFYDLPGGLTSLSLHIMRNVSGDLFLFYKNNIQNFYSTIYFLNYLLNNINIINNNINNNNKIFIVINNSHENQINNDRIEKINNLMRSLYMRNIAFENTKSIFKIPEISSLKSNSHLIFENNPGFEILEEFKNNFQRIYGGIKV